MKDETTFDLTDMERKDRWKYYTSSYVRVEPTEGVPKGRMKNPVLMRNLPNTDAEDLNSALQNRKPVAYSEDLTLRICVNTYRMIYKAGTSEWFVYSDGKKNEDALKAATEKRNARFKKMEKNNRWIRDGNKNPEEVEVINENFSKWMTDGPAGSTVEPKQD